MGLSPRITVKEKVDPKTGDIIRTSKEITTIYERIDAKSGKVKERIVGKELFDTKPKKDTAKGKRQEFIDRITKLVQNLEVRYAIGNGIIFYLKNYKPKRNMKAFRNKSNIPDRSKIEQLFDRKHWQYIKEHNLNDNVPEVVAKEKELKQELLNRLDEFKLEGKWVAEISELYPMILRVNDKPIVDKICDELTSKKDKQ